MNVTTEESGGVSIVRVGEARLMYPMLGDFADAVSALIASGKRDDPDRHVAGHLRGQRHDRLPDGSLPPGQQQPAAISSSPSVQKRVETMLTMTGAQNFIEIHADEPAAVKSFGV